MPATEPSMAPKSTFRSTMLFGAHFNARPFNLTSNCHCASTCITTPKTAPKSDRSSYTEPFSAPSKDSLPSLRKTLPENGLSFLFNVPTHLNDQFLYRPFWLSPRQAIVLPIGPSVNEYAERVRQNLYESGFQVDSELDAGLTINKKVRNAQLAQYNFILVVGEKEMSNNSVNVRTRDNKVHGECSLDQLIEKFNKFKTTKVLNAEEIFNQ